MTRPADAGRGATAFDGVPAALVDGRGRIVWWSRSAAELLGWPEAEITGTPARDLLAPPGTRAPAPAPAPYHHPRTRRLRHRSGELVEADVRVERGPEGGSAFLVAVPPDSPAPLDEDSALARALLDQEHMGAAFLDTGLRTVRTNGTFEALWPAGTDWLEELRDASGGASARYLVRRALAGGAPVVGAEYRIGPPDSERMVSLTCLRITDARGRPSGVVVVATELTEQYRAHRRLSLAYEGAVGIGGALDVVHCARDLASLLVPALGDYASVDLRKDVLEGWEPLAGYQGPQADQLRRVAVRAADGEWPGAMVQVGEFLPEIPDRPEFQGVAVGEEVVVSDAATTRRLLGDDPHLLAKLMPDGMRSSLGCPVYRRGRILGYVLVYRTTDPEPFDAGDTQLLKDLCARTALAIDHALRFTREHHTAVVLQRSLLPPSAGESAAAETDGTYLPASGTASVGGDWFDTFPMSSLRLALVVGDVIGHGLRATATMARLRTAVQTLADLDLAPDELLTHLDDLVIRIGAEAEEPDTVGASCLFLVYDPVSRVCQMASAGHPAPAIVRPGHDAEFADLVPGPPLGVGDNPFEVCSVTLPPGSVLALYTDGLVGRGLAEGPERLRRSLGTLCADGLGLKEIGTRIIEHQPPARESDDDITLLLARTRAVPDEDTAQWRYTADPAAVHDARDDIRAQLGAWGLEEHVFATELIVSELVTNAIRYAGEPVTLRLIRERVLVCEVSDPSNTQPRLRRAKSTDEGGRGLFLVAQIADRWGSRYGVHGKTIWTEQALGAGLGQRRRPTGTARKMP
ncbi:SpoIIE family protein phosphatase [Streptomyces sp. NPDC047028]|uniref:ATP-binding SpoIIE family protein phosphatase n=1 Tax=Streptomyces sp. NPDC047028 TaxID=3155793 RepID=UPI00340EE6EE